jgi:hypothetical protein
VQRSERTFGMAERLAQSRDVLEAQLDAEVLEREETIESGAQVRLCGFTTDAGKCRCRLG